MLSVYEDKSFVTVARFMVGMQRRGLVAGDKSLFSPLETEEKGIQRTLKTGKIKSPPEPVVYGHQCGTFAVGLKLMRAHSLSFPLSPSPPHPAIDKYITVMSL